MMTSIGFIPRTDQIAADQEDAWPCVNSLLEMLEAHQLAGVLDLAKLVQGSHDDVLKEVKRDAELLAQLDPANFSAAQEIGEVVLRLTSVATIQERLDTLTNEARRLKKAVAEARHQRRDRVVSAIVTVAGIGIGIAALCLTTIFMS